MASILLYACSNSDTALPDGIRFVERIEKTGDELVIPYSKYEMDNGLTIIIHEDHSDPIVHVDVTYHVGIGTRGATTFGFRSLLRAHDVPRIGQCGR
jgi:zinc protease